MAVIDSTQTHVGQATGTKGWIWTLGGADTGTPVFVGKHPDMQVSINPATHGGATSTFEWSIDERANPTHADHANAVWHGFTTLAGTAVSTTTTALGVQLLQAAWWARPKTTGGTVSSIQFRLKATIRG